MLKSLLKSRAQTGPEEIANSVTHGIGAALSLAGLVILVVNAVKFGTAWHVVGASIFGASLFFLYLSSCLYHAIHRPAAKRFLQVCDHGFIFVLIAGSYTPFVLGPIRGELGWWLFGIIWSLAISGFILKAIFLPRFQRRGALMYLLMGWLVVVAAVPLIENVPKAGLIWLVAGGLAYSFGIVFFVLERVKFFHTVWHFFVLAGSIAHFFAVFYGVIPQGN
ncbi:MAG: hemolysin III family protein [Verrucomicrobiales bacterium]|nr:hemolysin III family protein [Verrucomicrobiales bacterium]